MDALCLCRIDTENPRFLRVIFQFFMNFIEGETACQWQICNRTLLTCHILVHSKLYLEEKGLHKAWCNFVMKILHTFEKKTRVYLSMTNMTSLKTTSFCLITIPTEYSTSIDVNYSWFSTRKRFQRLF